MPKKISLTTPAVLVVDDNVDTAEMIRLSIEAKGREVYTVYCGYEAIKVAEELQPNLVVLDIGMPGLNGYEVAARLRAMPHMADISIIAITGDDRYKDPQLSIDAGINCLVFKPINIKKIEEILNLMQKLIK